MFWSKMQTVTNWYISGYYQGKFHTIVATGDIIGKHSPAFFEYTTGLNVMKSATGTIAELLSMLENAQVYITSEERRS